MPASSTSSISSRSSSSNSSSRSASKGHKLLLRAESDFDETRSVASSTSSRSSTSTLSRSSRVTGAVSASLATSCVSLRELELRKSQIEHELARVQNELQIRESQHAAARLASAPGQQGTTQPQSKLA